MLLKEYAEKIISYLQKKAPHHPFIVAYRAGATSEEALASHLLVMPENGKSVLFYLSKQN